MKLELIRVPLMREILDHPFIQKHILSGHRLIFIDTKTKKRQVEIDSTDPSIHMAVAIVDIAKHSNRPLGIVNNKEMNSATYYKVVCTIRALTCGDIVCNHYWDNVAAFAGNVYLEDASIEQLDWLCKVLRAPQFN